MRTFLRSIAFGLILGLVPAGFAQATCGIGSQLWEGNSSTGAKIMASITNIWTAKAISTTFEIAGCTEADNWFANASDARLRDFANQNFDHLAINIARGQGEHLDVLAHMIGLRESDRAEFRGLAQSHFVQLFPNDRVTVPEMLGTLSELMATSDALSSYVKI
jgi:hypothetical protein